MRPTRINDLPENALVQAVIDARQVDRERKGSPQTVAGGNLSYFTTETPGMGWQGRLDNIGLSGRGTAAFSITLEAATAEVPLTDIAIVVFTSADGVNWTEYTMRQGIIDSYNGTSPEITRFINLLQGAENTPRTTQYSLLLHGAPNVRAAFSVQAFGTDELTITVERTS